MAERLLNIASFVLGLAFSIAGQFLPRWASWPFFIVGLALVAFATWQTAKTYFRRGPFGGLLQRFAFGQYESRWASSPADIRAVGRLMGELMAREAPRQEVLTALHRRNDRSIRLIERRTGPSTALVGAVVIAPLTRAGITAIDNRTFRTIADLNLNKHVSSRWQNPPGVYIGAIAGTDRTSRIWALTGLELLLADIGNVPLYTRPVTPDGRRVAQKAGFTKIDDPSELWRR